MRRAWIVLGGLALALVGYYLPWYTHITAGFTMNAFDLAEWSSLHPAVRSSSPPLLTSFLLRFPQVALVAAGALAANRLNDERARWIIRAALAVVVLRFVPPKDFLTTASDDPNYRQMALLTVLGAVVLIGALAAYRLPQRWQTLALGGVLVLGVITGWAGLSRAYTLLDNFEIAVRVGAGPVLYTAACLAALIVALWPLTYRRVRAAESGA